MEFEDEGEDDEVELNIGSDELDSGGESVGSAGTECAEPEEYDEDVDSDDPDELTHHVCTKAANNNNPNKNEDVTEVLENLESYHSSCGQKWQALAVRKAISVLKQHPEKIRNGREAKKLKGIGDRIGGKIDEIIRTGKLQQLEIDPSAPTLRLFSGIWGIGPATAKTLYNKGFRTLSDLIKNQQSCLTREQRIGLKYHDEFAQKIPRDEVWLHGEVVKKVAFAISEHLEVIIGGSFRRGRSECGDIDLVICHRKSQAPSGILQELVTRLRDIHYLTDDLEMTEANATTDWNHHFDKYLGVAQLPKSYGGIHRRIDIIVIPNQNLAVTMLYFTGSQYFNRSMRHRARKIGFYVCNHAISKADVLGKRIEGTILPVKTEKEVFDLLGMEYRTPEERDW